MTAVMEVAINRPTKLRFPQGSEVDITASAKSGSIPKYGLTQPLTALADRMESAPIHQLNREPLLTTGDIGNQTIAFAKSSLDMCLSVALNAILMIGGGARRQRVPGRSQSIAEISCEFVASTVRST